MKKAVSKKNRKKSLVPSISNASLARGLSRIAYVENGVIDLKGTIHKTEEASEELFDWFKVKTDVDPRKQSFNFDDKRKLLPPALSLKPFKKLEIYVRIGGYYGFCKATFAEVYSQIPKKYLERTVAFSLDPEKNARIFDDNHQKLPIILFEKGEENDRFAKAPDIAIPAVDPEKVERLRPKLQPIIPYKDGPVFIKAEPGETPFMAVTIYLRVNGSHIRGGKELGPVPQGTKFLDEKKFTVYQEFVDDSDVFLPIYDRIVIQIPEEMVNEKTIGFAITGGIDLCRTKKGFVHKANCVLVEKD
jgi:hypothetical protein